MPFFQLRCPSHVGETHSKLFLPKIKVNLSDMVQNLRFYLNIYHIFDFFEIELEVVYHMHIFFLDLGQNYMFCCKSNKRPKLSLHDSKKFMKKICFILGALDCAICLLDPYNVSFHGVEGLGQIS